MGLKVVRSGGWIRILSRSLKVACVLVLLVFAGWPILGVEAASAARYAVAQCGWHVGQDAGWLETSNDKFIRDSYCQSPANVDPFEDVHLKSKTRGSAQWVAGTRFARWRWTAPAGTGIVTARGQRWQVLGDNFEHRLGGVTGSGFDPFLKLDTTDATRRDFSKAFSPNATAFESRLLCALPSDQNCKPRNERSAGVRALTFTLEDSHQPTVSVSGPASSSGWLRGTRALNFSGSDIGAGLLRSFTLIDGATGPQTEHVCAKSRIAGEWRGTKMQPCRSSVSGVHEIDTTRLSDGPHQLRQCSVDFAGNVGCIPDRVLRSDNNAPAAPGDLAVQGGDGWHRNNGFNLNWTIPDQGVASPVVASVMRVIGDGFDSGPLGNLKPGGADGVLVPKAGEYRISLWLVDAAGNQSPSNAVTAKVRFDDAAPDVYLQEPDRNRPELIRATFSDEHSGVANGWIAVRRKGGDKWITLPTDFSGSSTGELKARFPSDDLDPGIYELRAVVADRAGNLAVTSRRGNGSPMLLRAPIRIVTRIKARLRRKSHRGLSLRVPYRGGAILKARLTDQGGHGLVNQLVRVIQTPAAGSLVRASASPVRTGRGGWLRFLVPPGPSRGVALQFNGTERYLAASAGPLELKVRGRITLAGSPRRLSNGERVRFRGRISSRGVRRPSRGSPVEIQYQEKRSGRWRPVLTTRSGPGGRFRAAYRFRYITRPTRIKLRARLLPPPKYPYQGAVSRPVVVRVGS